MGCSRRSMGRGVRVTISICDRYEETRVRVPKRPGKLDAAPRLAECVTVHDEDV